MGDIRLKLVMWSSERFDTEARIKAIRDSVDKLRSMGMILKEFELIALPQGKTDQDEHDEVMHNIETLPARDVRKNPFYVQQAVKALRVFIAEHKIDLRRMSEILRDSHSSLAARLRYVERGGLMHVNVLKSYLRRLEDMSHPEASPELILAFRRAIAARSRGKETA